MIEVNHSMSTGLCCHPRAFDRTRASQHTPLDHIVERYGGEKHLDLSAEFLPQIVGKTAAGPAETAFRTLYAAARRLDRFINRNNDVGDAHFGCGLRQAVSAPRPSRGYNKAAAPELAEKL